MNWSYHSTDADTRTRLISNSDDAIINVLSVIPLQEVPVEACIPITLFVFQNLITSGYKRLFTE
jgi:hypothetical protein